MFMKEEVTCDTRNGSAENNAFPSQGLTTSYSQRGRGESADAGIRTSILHYWKDGTPAG